MHFSSKQIPIADSGRPCNQPYYSLARNTIPLRELFNGPISANITGLFGDYWLVERHFGSGERKSTHILFLSPHHHTPPSRSASGGDQGGEKNAEQRPCSPLTRVSFFGSPHHFGVRGTGSERRDKRKSSRKTSLLCFMPSGQTF